MFSNEKSRKLLSRLIKGDIFEEKVFQRAKSSPITGKSVLMTTQHAMVAMSLNEIIMMQKDEPGQEHFVYRV